MRQLVFPLQFKGKWLRWPGRYRAKLAATDQSWRSVFAQLGLDTGEGAEGGATTVVAEIEALVGHGVPDEGIGTFTEAGTITYGTSGAVIFQTVGQSIFTASAATGLRQGAIVLEITGGEGQLAGATGLITSNFSVTTANELVDLQVAQIFLP